MRTRQTARKSTTPINGGIRDPEPEARAIDHRDPVIARRIAAHREASQGLHAYREAQAQHLADANDALQNGYLDQLLHDDNPVAMLSNDRQHRVTSGRNGRLRAEARVQTARKNTGPDVYRPLIRTRQVARKYTGPDPNRYAYYNPRSQPSTTEARSKQVRKRPEDEVSPGGTQNSGPDTDPGPSTSSG